MNGMADVDVNKLSNPYKNEPAVDNSSALLIKNSLNANGSAQWSQYNIKGLSQRYMPGKNPNKMTTFAYVDNISNTNEKVCQMRA